MREQHENRLIRRVFGDKADVNRFPAVNRAMEAYLFVVVVSYVLLTIAPFVTLISSTPLSKIRMILGLLGGGLLAVDLVTNRGLWRGKNVGLLYGICASAAISSLLYIRYGVKDNVFDLCWVVIQFGLAYTLAERLTEAEMKRFVCRVYTVTLLIWFAACCVSVYQFARQIGYRYTVNPNSDSPELCRQGFWNHRLFGVFTGLDYAAYISLAHIVLGVHYLIEHKKPLERGALAVALLPIFLFIVLSGSRSAKYALLLYAAVFAWMAAGRNGGGFKVLLRRGVAAVLTLVVVYGCYAGVKEYAPYVPAYFNRMTQVSSPDGTQQFAPPEATEPDDDLLERTDVQGDISNERFQIWHDYLHMAGEYGPFGLSLSNYNDYIAEHHADLYIVQYFRDRLGDMEKTDMVYECHNNYLFVLVSTGWVGLALFVLFAVLTIWKALRFCFTAKPLPLSFITALALVGIGCVQAMFMNSVFLKINAPSFIFWLALGVVNQMTRQEKAA